MPRFVSKRRPLIHAALAALVVAALSRCSWEESRELAQSHRIMAIQAAGQTAPIQAPIHDCDRESGCICRGATQVVAITAPQGQADLTELLPPPISEYLGSWLGDVAGEQGGDRDTHLGAGELEGQRVAGVLHMSSSAIADLLDVRVDSAAFHRSEGELGRDEDEGARGQRNEREQAPEWSPEKSPEEIPDAA